MKNLKYLIVGIVFGASLFVATGSASAHGNLFFYEEVFNDSQSDPNPVFGHLQFDLDGNTWRLNKTISDSDFAADEWNDVGTTIGIDSYGGQNGLLVWNSDPCSIGFAKEIVVMSYDYAPGAWGGAFVSDCIQPGTTYLNKMSLVLDFAPNWHTGGGSVPAGDFDLRSVLSHEYGHALGFGVGTAPDHFPVTTTQCVPSQASKPTMCPGLPSGTSWMRTLNGHDEHEFSEGYN